MKQQSERDGLKQSAKFWIDKINEILLQLEFPRSVADASLYSKMEGKDWIYILLYVDNMLIACKNQNNIGKTFIKQVFSITNLREIKRKTPIFLKFP